MNDYIRKAQIAFAHDFTKSSLKTIIILWAIFIIALTLVVDNVWLLAGILAYEVLP